METEQMMSLFLAAIKAGFEEIIAEMRAGHQEEMAEMRAWRKGMKAGREKTRLPLECKGPTSEDMESGPEHREVPKEHSAVETGRALKNRHRGRHLAVGRCGKPRERTQSNDWCRKKLAATCRVITHSAGVARHKGHGRKRQNKDDGGKGTQKEEWTRRDVGRTQDAKMA
jgi:hypothetical protein